MSYGYIQWKQKKTIEGTYKQNAYDDTWEEQIPFVLTALGEQLLQKGEVLNMVQSMSNAVHAKAHTRGIGYGSSAGAQNAGIKSIDWQNRVIITKHSCYIGD
jgi:hypothetical protein